MKQGKIKQSHTSSDKIGKGESLGSGVKQPMGIMREDYMSFANPKPANTKKPPKSLA